MATRARRLDKKADYTNQVVTVKVLSTGAELICDAKTLPEEIRQKMITLGISHRIGDSAAGQDGAEALASMEKVWKGLVAGDFSVRAPAAKAGISMADIQAKLAGLTGRDAAAAAALLEKLGIKLG
jgi:hypothetical protein